MSREERREAKGLSIGKIFPKVFSRRKGKPVKSGGAGAGQGFADFPIYAIMEEKKGNAKQRNAKEAKK